MAPLLPFADVILRTLSAIADVTGKPVRTAVLAELIGVAAVRTVRKYLARLEQAGLVTRRSPKSGWLPA